MQNKHCVETLHGNGFCVVLACSQGCSGGGVFCLFLFLTNTQIQFRNNYRTGSPFIGVCAPCDASYL